MNSLWYNAPAEEYICGLPIGTGRLAGMVYGSALQPRDTLLLKNVTGLNHL